jgi:ABC-type uncharacterized transport system involved in gliding motility auxiliary subunit
LGGRQAKYGSNALLVLLGIIGIVVLVNYLANQYPQRWDLTEDANNTLAPETEEILANLPGKVQVTAFYSDATQTENARQILDNFTFASSSWRRSPGEGDAGLGLGDRGIDKADRAFAMAPVLA